LGGRGYQKSAWILIALVGIVGILFGIGTVVVGDAVIDPPFLTHLLGQSPSSFAASNPTAWSTVVTYTQFLGVTLIGFSIFGTAIAYTGYRRGERWAWYAELSVPAYIVYSIVVVYTDGGANWPLFSVLLLVSLAGLVLPYRKFFPKK